MSFGRMEKNVLNISALDNKPSCTAEELKATFDRAGEDIRNALNNLMTELEDKMAANNIGADVSSVTTKTLQAILNSFEESIKDRYSKTEASTLIDTATNELVKDIDVDLTSGVITVTKKDGSSETFDTPIEKVPAKFEIIEEEGKFSLKITNVDGTFTKTDVTNLMNVYKFDNSDYISFDASGDGFEKTVTASIKANSIGLDKLSISVVSKLEEYMTSAKDSASAAKTSETNANESANSALESKNVAEEAATSAINSAEQATTASQTAQEKATETNNNALLTKSYAVGGTGTRDGEDEDNAKYYSERAKEIVGGDYATHSELTSAIDGAKEYTDTKINDLKETEINKMSEHIDDTSIHVTTAEKQKWDGKSDFSGNFNDLTSKPTITTQNIVTNFWHGTQAEYDAIETKEATTLYLIDEE